MRRTLTVVALSLSVWSASAQSMDSVELHAFMDGMFETLIRDRHVAGATVAIVKDQKTVLAKGYGYSSLEARTPVSPDSTLFRIGSISKVFVWISVMELVAQGKLKLDENVNNYLKGFAIPDTYQEPITLKHLMTHTAGFEDEVLGLFVQDSSAMKTMRDAIVTGLPRRVRPPGVAASYSNHGSAVAATVVENQSGRNFNDYVENNILIPMQMHMTTFRQPLPSFLRPMMSKGYSVVDGQPMPKPFEFVSLYPAGAASSTASDMARLMKALLNDGRYNSNSILDSATLNAMLKPAFRAHPAVNPMLHGFIDYSRNGVMAYGHGGDTFWFHSMMVLFPEYHTGLFFSTNSETGGQITDVVLREFMDHYFPDHRSLKPAVKMTPEFFNAFAGEYRSNRYNRHDLTVIGSLMANGSISVVDSSRLRLKLWGRVRDFVPLDSLSFREVNSAETIAFGKNEEGQITDLFIGTVPIVVFNRISGLHSALPHLILLIVILMTTLGILIYWPITHRARRGYEYTGNTFPLPGGARVTAWFNYFLLAVFYVGVAIVLHDPRTIVYGVPLTLKMLLAVPFAIILTTIVMYMQLYRLYSQRRYTDFGRLVYFVITVISTAAIWQLYFWNLVGYNY